jgi:hypothetical protein
MIEFVLVLFLLSVVSVVLSFANLPVDNMPLAIRTAYTIYTHVWTSVFLFCIGMTLLFLAA